MKQSHPHTHTQSNIKLERRERLCFKVNMNSMGTQNKLITDLWQSGSFIDQRGNNLVSFIALDDTHTHTYLYPSQLALVINHKALLAPKRQLGNPPFPVPFQPP